MASPHVSALDDVHHSTAPPNMIAHTQAHTHADAPSPTTTFSAATAATTFASNRPPTTHIDYDDDDDDDDEDEDDDDDDDDYAGGISITSADYQTPDTNMADEDVVLLSSVTGQLLTAPTFDLVDHFLAVPSYQMPSISTPIPHLYTGFTSSSDPSLEPPPTLQEAHLSIKDNHPFLPITSFFHSTAPEKPTVPGLDLVQPPATITSDDLRGDQLDFQGIDWSVRKTKRSQIRARRAECESARAPPHLHEIREHIPPVPNTDNFFQFKRNNTAHHAFFPHFQLRNVLAVTSRNDIFYAAGQQVYRTNAEGTSPDLMIEMRRPLAIEAAITTIASNDHVLIAGAFDGEYAITDLSSAQSSPSTFGRADYTMDATSRIVNHMHLFESRTNYQPQAVLCSNDFRLRTLDLATDTFTNTFLYPAAVNCTATSPNGRMRVVVGDFHQTLITNAETGQPFETLKSHTDDTFACAWADDGIHVATAAQDSTIVVWDARSWARPLTVLASEVSVPRSLHFSPVGSGPRVLVAADADDYVNVYNAQTFQSKQMFDFFGPIGGVSFTPDGQSLFVANCERRFGGIVELERTGWAESTAKHSSAEDSDWDDLATDWEYDHRLSSNDRVSAGSVERERRGLDLGCVVV